MSDDLPYVGMDFGTSTTLLARQRGAAGMEVLPIGQGTEWLPSVVGFEQPSLPFIIGEAAEFLPPHKIIRSIKTEITHENTRIPVRLEDREVSIEVDMIAGLIIKEALARANWPKIKNSVAGIRASCPAMWDRDQRERLRRIFASQGIDLELHQVVDEPIAAGLAWLQHRRLAADGRQEEGNVLVFDYGGGTLDIAVGSVEWDHDRPKITVNACEGDRRAGDELDKRLSSYVEGQLSAEELSDLTGEKSAAIRREVRLAKERLSTTDEVVLRLQPYGMRNITLTRGELEFEFGELLDDAIDLTFRVLRLARLRQDIRSSSSDVARIPRQELASDIDFVILAGGMTQIPCVSRRLQEEFANAKIEQVSARDRGALRGPQDLVVAGLVHSVETYDRINLHRPAFDIRVEWQDRRGTWFGRTAYRAYTPLYSREELNSHRTHLGYKNSISIPSDVKIARSRIALVSPSGDHMNLKLDDVVMDGVEIALRPGASVDMKLYLNGGLIIRVDGGDPLLSHAGSGRLRIAGWPVIGGRDSGGQEIEIRTWSPNDPLHNQYA